MSNRTGGLTGDWGEGENIDGSHISSRLFRVNDHGGVILLSLDFIALQFYH